MTSVSLKNQNDRISGKKNLEAKYSDFRTNYAEPPLQPIQRPEIIKVVDQRESLNNSEIKTLKPSEEMKSLQPPVETKVLFAAKVDSV